MGQKNRGYGEVVFYIPEKGGKDVKKRNIYLLCRGRPEEKRRKRRKIFGEEKYIFCKGEEKHGKGDFFSRGEEKRRGKIFGEGKLLQTGRDGRTSKALEQEKEVQIITFGIGYELLQRKLMSKTNPHVAKFAFEVRVLSVLQ